MPKSKRKLPPLPSKMPKRCMNDREASHILAALRLWQKDGCRAFEDIATNGGDHELMCDFEIDELCEKLNSGEVY